MLHCKYQWKFTENCNTLLPYITAWIFRTQKCCKFYQIVQNVHQWIPSQNKISTDFLCLIMHSQYIVHWVANMLPTCNICFIPSGDHPVPDRRPAVPPDPGHLWSDCSGQLPQSDGYSPATRSQHWGLHSTADSSGVPVTGVFDQFQESGLGCLVNIIQNYF